MNSNNQSAIQACELRFFRKIEGKTRRDRIRNKIIRETVGVQPIQEYVERSQFRWYGHINRMDDNRIVKRVCEAGKRPRETWKEGLKEVTRKKRVTWKEVKRTVKDRKKWKDL
jgi:(2Fe-2S) ferredoxin